jgi:hyaluronoglucosaminidase
MKKVARLVVEQPVAFKHTLDLPLGIIEGFYGPSWSWSERVKLLDTLAPAGFSFYIYAPKSHDRLRRKWREPHDETSTDALIEFSEQCKARNVAFGVGLSPYGVCEDFTPVVRQRLIQKVGALNALSPDIIAILFDDMRGDIPGLAKTQAQVVELIAERSTARRIVMCPTYYSDDSVLDRVFGNRHENYLSDLGRLLDKRVDVFWTGEEVCSREIGSGHLSRVAKQLGRVPVLWDNYPVNDGPRMSPHLHLRAFTGRPATNAPLLAAHAINPALQPTLSLIPALTLIDCYQGASEYQYQQSWERAARLVLGPALAKCVREDLLLLEDWGLDRLGDKKHLLRERYSRFEHPAAREIVRWLRGEYAVSAEVVQTQ